MDQNSNNQADLRCLPELFWSQVLPPRWSTRTLRSVVVAVCLFAGCAQWSPKAENDKAQPGLAAPRLNPDSVVVETVVVRFPASSTQQLDEIWRDVDETVLDISLRRRLDNNGMRLGVLDGTLPKLFRDRLQDIGARQSTDALEHAGLAADIDHKMRQLHCHAGRRKDVIVRREVADTLTVLAAVDGQRVSGESFEKASTLFDMRAIPKGDGTVTLELTPEIQHGEHRKTFVTTEFGVRPELKRLQKRWDELAVRLTVKPGQVVMLSSTLPPKSIGKAFFLTSTAEATQEHVVLLLRVTETDLDELFAPEVIEQAKALAER